MSQYCNYTAAKFWIKSRQKTQNALCTRSPTTNPTHLDQNSRGCRAWEPKWSTHSTATAQYSRNPPNCKGLHYQKLRKRKPRLDNYTSDLWTLKSTNKQTRRHSRGSKMPPTSTPTSTLKQPRYAWHTKLGMQRSRLLLRMRSTRW